MKAMAQLIPKVAGRLFTTYIKWVYATARHSLDLGGASLDDCIIVFWHGDSFTMNLLSSMAPKYTTSSIWAAVTEDRRGEYIQRVLEGSGVHALRLPDGTGMKDHLNAMAALASSKDTSLCIALDGPLGPLHQPKKLAFWLSRYSGKPVVGVRAEYSRKLTLHRRWDKYSIPLPYTSISFSCHSFGVADSGFIRNFKDNAGCIREFMC